MKTALVLALAILGGAVGMMALFSSNVRAPRLPEASPPVMVDFTSDSTLLPVFGAGLQPRRVRGLENYACIVPNRALGFRLGDIVLPPMTANWQFNVNGTGEVTSVRGYVNDRWTKQEAGLMASGYEDALGGDPARLRIWIDDYPNSSVDGETYGRHKWVEEGVKAGYYLRHSMNRWRPLSMTAVIEWRRPSHETFFGDSVLVPPPGFEHLDMSVLD